MSERGVSEALGFVIVFSLVLLTATAASVGGIQSLESTSEFQEVENTERAFGILASNLAEIHDERVPSRATEITVSQGRLQYGATTTLNVTAEDGASTSERTYDIAPIVYELPPDRRIVYAGGAMFRMNGEDGVVVRDPPFRLKNQRVLISAVATTTNDTSRTVGSTTVLVRAEATSRNLSLADSDGTYDDVFVNVTSERADLWQNYLEETDMEDCTTGTDADGEEFVECHLGASPEAVYLSATGIEVRFES
ncbi:MAG: hypothetical protein ABEH56_01160 [Salinirussus sp.]